MARSADQSLALSSRSIHAKNRRIIVTEDDYSLLRRLASHPQLAAELNAADVVDSAVVPPDVVTMNSRVLFEDETIGERREVTIVFPQQSDASGRVSVLAPVGTALLGLAAGQWIVWPFRTANHIACVCSELSMSQRPGQPPPTH